MRRLILATLFVLAAKAQTQVDWSSIKNKPDLATYTIGVGAPADPCPAPGRIYIDLTGLRSYLCPSQGGAWFADTGGTGTPGGDSGQIQINNSGVFAGITISGDGTLNTSGVLTVTKTNGTAFGTAATKNTGTGSSDVATGDHNHDNAYPAKSLLTTLGDLPYYNSGWARLAASVGWLKWTGTAYTFSSPTKGDVGLANVDNTADASKPVSTAQQAALDAKTTGPGSSTDKAIPRFSGAGGKTLQGSGVVIDDSNNLTTPGSVTAGGLTGTGPYSASGPAVTLSTGLAASRPACSTTPIAYLASDTHALTVCNTSTSTWGPTLNPAGGFAQIYNLGTGKTECYKDDGTSCSPTGTSTTVSVEGSGVTDPNFNATTPAAESGYLNCKVRATGSNVSIECPFATSVGSPGVNTQGVTEKAVRDLFATINGITVDSGVNACTHYVAVPADWNSTGSAGLCAYDATYLYYYAGARWQRIAWDGSWGTPTVAQPAFDVGTGTYNTDKTITITDSTAGATIKYCTDTAGTCDPSTGTIIASGGTVSIGTTGTHLRAYATHSGYTDSLTRDVTYYFQVATVTASPSSGTVNVGDTLTWGSSPTTGVTYRYTSDGSTPNCSSPNTGNATVSGSAGPVTYKVIGCKTNYDASGVAPFTYTISAGPALVTSTGTPRAGGKSCAAAQCVTNSFSATAGNAIVSVVAGPVSWTGHTVTEACTGVTAHLSGWTGPGDTANELTPIATKVNTYLCMVAFYGTLPTTKSETITYGFPAGMSFPQSGMSLAEAQFSGLTNPVVGDGSCSSATTGAQTSPTSCSAVITPTATGVTVGIYANYYYNGTVTYGSSGLANVAHFAGTSGSQPLLDIAYKITGSATTPSFADTASSIYSAAIGVALK